MIDSHTHSSYSKHAVGSIDDLVCMALAKGVRILTITDHAPFFVDENNRLLKSELQQYLLDIEQAKAKYAGEITILKGLELDFMPGAYDYLARMVSKLDLDFLIGSIHYIPVNNEHVKVWDLQRLNNPGVLESYFTVLEELLQSGLFDAVGHPDALLRAIPDSVFLEYLEPLLPLFTRNKIAYELNSSGLRKTALDPLSGCEAVNIWSYPSLSILPQLITQNISCTIGSDAHAPADVGEGIEELLQMLIPAGLNTVSYFENRRRIDAPVHSLCLAP